MKRWQDSWIGWTEQDIRDELRPWVGAEEDDNVGQAAGNAAYAELQNSSFPPTRDDTGRIGAAAGNAACHAAAGATYGATEVANALGLCSAIGEYIGKAIYDIFEGLFKGEEYVAPQFDHVIYRRTRDAAIRLAQLKYGTRVGPGQYRPSADETNEMLIALGKRGVPAVELAMGPGPTEAERGPWRPYFSHGGLDIYLKKLSVAEGSIGAELIVAHRHKGLRVPPKRSSGAGTVLLAAAGAGGLLWLLASAI